MIGFVVPLIILSFVAMLFAHYRRKRETPFTVTVTKDDIATGTPFSTSSCPIAKAMLRKKGWDRGVMVLGTRALVGSSTFGLPHEAQEFICDLDHGRPVRPFSFELELRR